MSLALKRLQNIGWMALVFMIAILLYPLSLNVGVLHSRLVSMDARILETKREISFLQAELRTRASMAQLEDWNNLLYGYQPPTAEQFLDSETQLAALGRIGREMKPVMVAVSQVDSTAPAGVVGDVRFAKLETTVAADDGGARKVAMADSTAGPPPTRTERLAGMDAKLLSDDFLKEIGHRSEKEIRRQ